MALTGKLDDVDFSDVLQMLARGGKSGKLTLTQYAGQGVVVLRRGKIVYAASSAARETLGHILVCRGLISEEELKAALEAQTREPEERRLGTILVEAGALSQEVLEQVIGDQVARTISEFLAWDSGYFRFERIDLLPGGEVEVDAGDLQLGDGLPADQVLLKGIARQLEAEESRAGGSRSVDDGPRVTSLKSIMNELHAPQLIGEVTLQILRYAQQFLQRGVFFHAGRRGFTGAGQFGVTPPPGAAPDFVRQIEIPRSETSILGQAIARKAVWQGALENSKSNRLLARQLGGEWPGEALVGPLIVNGRVLAVFYGDNLPAGEEIVGADEFEVALLHAGVTIEKNLLAKRVEYLEERRSA